MAKFTYDHPHHKHLILGPDDPDPKSTDEAKPWAEFVNGVFETDDTKVIARLKGVEGVSEVTEPVKPTA